ncbi:MAG: hypothetical protein ABIZ82_05310, partial [Candidatus Tumulicola sp.]
MSHDLDGIFRAQMRALAHRGGAATKKLMASDPKYYRRIGKIGGRASVTARKARIAADLNVVKPGEAPIIESPAAHSAQIEAAAPAKVTLGSI